MLETQFYGKLLPTHPDIMSILLDIREKYNIPEISPNSNGLKKLLMHGLGIRWKSVHSEILERLKDTPSFIPEETRQIYLKFKEFQLKGLVDPELKTVSKKLRKDITTIFEVFLKMYEPQAVQIDNFYHAIADHCIEFLLTGEAREIPQNWLAYVNTENTSGEKVVVAVANALADPDAIAEIFKAECLKSFGKHEPKITEEQIKTADYLRLKYFDKPLDYLLEEEEIRDPKTYRGKKSRRYPTAARRHHSRMRQRLYRLEKQLSKILK
jgi:hypothetical protein